jgi:predicted DNA-binding transcriptional regulator AlpA
MAKHDILDKVVKLKRMAESAEKLPGSEDEAQAFARMFQKLMTDHKIEMSDVEFKELDISDPVIAKFMDYGQYPDLKLKSRRVAWSETLAMVVAKAHFCRSLVYDRSNRVTFVGRKSDREVAEYMFVTLHRAADKLADTAYAEFTTKCVKECELCGAPKNIDAHRLVNGKPTVRFQLTGGRVVMTHKFKPNWRKARGFRPSFIQSFVYRLFERYEEEKRRLLGVSDSTALVRLNKAANDVDEWMDQKKIPTAKALDGPNAFNKHGVILGEQAANNVSIAANALGGDSTKVLKA